ncbi:RidA family protein [Daejeonella lutea]|uniref:Enamine deaminase RidA, house cleaning of reactive enamine intermediates, YjgF/YER057c/UK114 family n=1 Tax=Daejeonella lutea TaxID=572036 RepID=A0A1T5A8R0_9SPHI|nr:Rid family hydrolase [Daejeonella lutea]SKB31310.1 Enamine deaminase RidA, house cleaning of reactive enamine intermediates, YjgF/YER057c/UK114 family [Daejeonella lutea]
MKTQRRDILKAFAAGIVGIAGLGFANKVKADAVHITGESAIKNRYPEEPVKFTKLGNLIFASGFICLPHEGPRTLENHTKVAMGKLEAALKEAGSSLDKLHRVTAWIDDPANYFPLNAPYAAAFPGGRRKGNRSCMAVSPGNIPGNSMVAFDAIARV